MKVDVVGPADRRWLALPADAPVGDLLPELVRLLAGPEVEEPPEGGGWALAPPVGRPLDAGASLRAGGILPGSTLCLVGARLAADADGVLPPHALVGMRTPVQRTAAALPSRLAGWARVRTALALARQPAPAAPPPSRDEVPLHPASFTEVRRARLWRRAWQAWQALDHVGRMEAAITAPRLRRGVTAAVVSPVPGVGKTVVTTLLGSLLAHLRRDRVIALDAHPGDGSLAALAVPGSAWFAPDPVSARLGPGLTLTQLDASLAPGYHGLRVLPAPPAPETLVVLRRFAGVLLVDCEADLEAPATRLAIEAANQVLVVTDATPEARAALGGVVDLVRSGGGSALVVANAPRSPAGPRDAGRLAVSAPAAAGLVQLPWCPAGVDQLAAGTFDWEHPPGAWRRAAHELATAIVRDWGRLGLTQPAGERLPQAVLDR